MIRINLRGRQKGKREKGKGSLRENQVKVGRFSIIVVKKRSSIMKVVGNFDNGCCRKKKGREKR